MLVSPVNVSGLLATVESALQGASNIPLQVEDSTKAPDVPQHVRHACTFCTHGCTHRNSKATLHLDSLPRHQSLLLQEAERLKHENEELRKLGEDAVLDQQLSKALQETDKLKLAADAYKKELLQQKVSELQAELVQTNKKLKAAEEKGTGSLCCILIVICQSVYKLLISATDPFAHQCSLHSGHAYLDLTCAHDTLALTCLSPVADAIISSLGNDRQPHQTLYVKAAQHDVL